MNQIPENIKRDVWKMYEWALSPDPSLSAQYAVKTVSHLKVIMRIGNMSDFDNDLKESEQLAAEALLAYTDNNREGHIGESQLLATQAMEKIGHIIYDKDERFAIRDTAAFTGR